VVSPTLIDRPLVRRSHGMTLIEVLVASGLLAMVLVAVLSFYLEATAVSVKKDAQSQRLRRFSLGMEKLEQALRGSRVIRVEDRAVTFHRLDENQPDIGGFPNYASQPAQFVSTEQGVVYLEGDTQRLILPTEGKEHVQFRYLTEQPESDPPAPPEGYVLGIALYAESDERSDQFFHRTIVVPRY
jgi:prepilin-type N-terminal cleavage/methylation domain-containing protein